MIYISFARTKRLTEKVYKLYNSKNNYIEQTLLIIKRFYQVKIVDIIPYIITSGTCLPLE
jgi:hypothetical protein